MTYYICTVKKYDWIISKGRKLSSTYYIILLSSVWNHCKVIGLVLPVVHRHKIFKPKAGVCLVLSSDRIEPICPWVWILYVLLLIHFLERVEILIWCRWVCYLLTCPLFVFIYAYSFLSMPDWLRRQWEVVLPKTILIFTLFFNLIFSQHDMGFVRIFIYFMIDIFLSVKRSEGLEACFILVCMLMSVLKLIYVSDIWKVLFVDELGRLQLTHATEYALIWQINLH